MCSECRGYLIGQMEDTTVMWKFMTFSLKLYIPFLKDVCEFVLPFGSSGVLTGLYAKEKYTCNQLGDVCVQMGVSLLVDVKD